jgi:uncharacterized membrane protein
MHRRLPGKGRSRLKRLRDLPLLNKTGMTDGERELLRRWVEQGAPTDE